jgi:hypothetical protein
MDRLPFQVLVPYRQRSIQLQVAIFHRRDLNRWQFIFRGW